MSTSMDTSASVYVADSRVDQRVTIRDALKELGFTNIKIGASLQEIVDLISVDDTPPAWIITSTMLDENINILEILGLCISDAFLHNTKVSLIAAPEEKNLLPKAFELGLLSFHLKPFTKASLKDEFSKLIQRLHGDKTLGCLTAAYYLKSYLLEADDFKSTSQLIESLIRLYPGNAQLFLDLAEAQQMQGLNKDALRTLSQAKHLGADVAKAAKQIEALVQSEDPESASDSTQNASTFADAFKIKTAVLIDPDKTVQSMLTEILKELGINQVQKFQDGEAAWQWVTSNPDEVSVFIQEWRIPGLSSPALIQRYRDKGITAPVIIFSGLVKNNDKHLLKEIGVSQLIEKPLTREYFAPKFMACIRQERSPDSYKSLSRQFQIAIGSNHKKEAKELYDRLNAVENVPQPLLLVTTAEWLFYEGDYEGAKQLVFSAMSSGGDTLRGLNLLGRIFMKLRKFDDAIKCFNKAQEMSSGNLERLCMLAEALVENGDVEGAELSIEKAKGIDLTNPSITATEAKIALTSGNTDLAKSLVAKLDTLNDIVAYTNNRAISLSKQTKVSEAIDLYSTALKSLPTSAEELTAKISYNLALAHIRAANMQAAKNSLRPVLAFTKTSVYAKIKNLDSRLDQALASGKIIQIKNEDEPSAIAPTKTKGMVTGLNIVAIDARPGDLRCHLVYSAGHLGIGVETHLRRLPRLLRKKPEMS